MLARKTSTNIYIIHIFYNRNYLHIHLAGEGHFGTVHRARACGIVTPGENITVAVKMCKTIEGNSMSAHVQSDETLFHVLQIMQTRQDSVNTACVWK